MAEQTLDERQKISRELEDIHNSITSALEKVARLQLETEQTDPQMQDELGACVSGLSELAEKVQGLSSDYEMETARRQNEDEL